MLKEGLLLTKTLPLVMFASFALVAAFISSRAAMRPVKVCNSRLVSTSAEAFAHEATKNVTNNSAMLVFMVNNSE